MALIDEPLLILAGANDKATPVVLSKDLYAASHLPEGKKQLLVVDGADHNDVLMSPVTISAYREFLDRLR